MVDIKSIPDNRPLTTEERSLIQWLLTHGTPTAEKFLTQLETASVATRCYCGCASIDFAIGGVVPPAGNGINILADYQYQSSTGDLFGVFVFERADLLAGLEVWSVDGKSTPSTLPQIEQLKPLLISRPNA